MMTFKRATLRLPLIGLVIIFLAAANLVASPPAVAEPGYAAWFEPAQAKMQTWSFSEVPGDPNQLTIRHRDADKMGPTRSIFVLFPRRSSAYDVALNRMLDVFEEKGINAKFTVVNFENDPTQGRQAIEFAEKGEHELIISMGSQSTAWLWENYRGGELPVVSVCSKDPVVLGQADSYESGTGTNFAFTSLNMPIEVQMAYVLELKPSLKNLAVLVNSKNVSAVETQAKPISEYARSRGIRVIDVAVEDPKHAGEELAYKVRDAVATMRKNDPTLNHSLFWITGSTAVFREIRAINANSDRVPVLSVVPDVVTAGDDSAALSIGISFESNAHLAAIYAADVLEGRTKVGELKVGIVSPPDIAISFRKAREIALEIPFSFIEGASDIYDYEGRKVRNNGKPVTAIN